MVREEVHRQVRHAIAVEVMAVAVLAGEGRAGVVVDRVRTGRAFVGGDRATDAVGVGRGCWNAARDCDPHASNPAKKNSHSDRNRNITTIPP